MAAVALAAALRERFGLGAGASAAAGWADGALPFSLISFATVSEGNAPLPTQAANRSASIWTVAGFVGILGLAWVYAYREGVLEWK